MPRLSTVALCIGAALVSAHPCDIYDLGGTPCVAAHSTTRALYLSFSGALYQVKRSDGTTKDIAPLAAGGVANATTQDSFCANTSCLITIIYDQSGNGNHLTQAPPKVGSSGYGGSIGGGTYGGGGSYGNGDHPPVPFRPGNGNHAPLDNLANATAAPVTLDGIKAYGVYIPPGTGYRNDNTTKVAKGNEPEGIYAVFDGTHVGTGCCFDYGNAETKPEDDGDGTMEAINFSTRFGSPQNQKTGNGPWVQVDMENGVYASINASDPSPSIEAPFVTAVLKGGDNRYVLAGGSSVFGPLTTYYDGPRPQQAYVVMRKEGGIVLGVGGDNSDAGEGTFYEGSLTAGFPAEEVDQAVQADIVAAHYAAYNPSVEGL